MDWTQSHYGTVYPSAGLLISAPWLALASPKEIHYHATPVAIVAKRVAPNEHTTPEQFE